MMSCSASTPLPEQLALLSRVVRQIARSRRLSPPDAEDFLQSVHLRLLERHYDIFERFTGRSSLRSYLTVAVDRMLLDWRNAMYGKWRPSAMAVKLGAHAVTLDRLIHRDGHTIDEAIQICGASRGVPADSELRRLAERLPRREPRRMVSEDALEARAGTAFEDPIHADEQRRSRQRILRALANAVRRLPPEDRQLIDLRYRQGRSVQAVAQLLDTPPKPLYRRFEQSLRTLHQMLQTAGITGSGAIDHRPPERSMIINRRAYV